MIPKRVNHHLSHFAQERLGEPELAPKASRPSKDQPQYIVAPLVAGDHAIAHHEGDSPSMIGDHAVGHNVLLNLVVAVTKHLLDTIQDGHEQIRFIVRVNILRDSRHPLQTKPGIDVLGRQILKRTVSITVVLNEHQVPDLKEAGAVTIHTADMPWLVLLVAILQPPVIVDLTTRATGTGGTHSPEVIHPPKRQNLLRVYVRLPLPTSTRLLVSRQISFVVLKDRCPQTFLLHPPNLGHQFPGPGDDLLFVIIAKRPIAHHLEKGMMVGRWSHGFQVVQMA